MFHKIISTIGARVGLAGISFVLLWAVAKYFGPAGTGEVRLLMLNISIILLFTSFLGGPNLVYLVPRTNLFKLVVNAYWWAVVTSAAVTGVLWLLNQTYSTGALNLFLISALQAATVVHHMVLVGKEDIRQYNIVSLLHAVLMLGVFGFNMFVLDNWRVSSYVWALYVASGLSLLYSIPVTWKYITIGPLKGLLQVVREALRYGFYNQVGNIAQLLNYRFSYYLLESLSAKGLADVGVYSIGVNLAEALWIVQRAIGVVQYGRISNTSDREYQVKLTVSLMKVSGMFVLLMVIPLMLIPASLYELVFGAGFGDSRTAVICLSPGIVAFAVSGMLSGFFAGTGKHHINTIASGAGLAITLGLGLWLIPLHGLIGAGVTASVSYCLSTLVQLGVFMRSEKVGFMAMVPNASDGRELLSLVRAYLRKNGQETEA